MKADPKLLLSELCKGATLRKVQTLQLIYRLCEEQQVHGSSDYSIATIGRLSSEQGGPSAAAIRNKPGEDYRALIKTYAESVHGHSRKTTNKLKNDADELLEGVVDPVLKVRIRLLLAEVGSMRAQLLAVRHLANQTAVLDLPMSEVLNGKSEESKFRLTLQEVSALEAAVSQATLAHWGWKVDQAGRITNDSGQVVFRAGFSSAVQKTVAYFADY